MTLGRFSVSFSFIWFNKKTPKTSRNWFLGVFLKLCDDKETENRPLSPCLPCLLFQIEADEADMDQQDAGNADCEFGMPGLVVIDQHAKQGPDASSDNGQEDEGPFRNAPLMADRPAFVGPVEEKGDQVDDQEPDRYKVHDCMEKRQEHRDSPFAVVFDFLIVA